LILDNEIDLFFFLLIEGVHNMMLLSVDALIIHIISALAYMLETHKETTSF